MVLKCVFELDFFVEDFKCWDYYKFNKCYSFNFQLIYVRVKRIKNKILPDILDLWVADVCR